jgi:hypothetical protein
VPVDHIAAELFGGEAIIINLADGTYHSLVGAAADAWALIAAGLSEAVTVVALTQRFDVPVADIETGVAALVDDLVAADLLVPADRPRQPPAVPELDPPTGGWETPVLTSYTDMQDMLALDPPIPGLSGLPGDPG